MYEMQTFDTIMERMLSRVSSELDKREGSVIYDALAPAALELSNAYAELDSVITNTFPSTCDREFLVQFAAEKGMTPIAATPAVLKLITTPSYVDVPIDTIVSIGTYNYSITAKIADGEYEATCDTPGIAGGVITPEMVVVPLEEVPGLESITFDSVIIEGTEEEDTENLRKRYIDSLKPYAFGGNIADYQVKTLSIDGVGACKVFRAGTEYEPPLPIPGGYVTVLVLDKNYAPASAELVAKVQNILDPDAGTGKGLAPIGHVVTVDTCTQADITISINIETTDAEYGEELEAVIRGTIQQHFIDLRKTWGTSDGGIIIRRSQLEEMIFSINTVSDVQVTELKVTGSSDTSHNLELGVQKIPNLDVLNITPANGG